MLPRRAGSWFIVVTPKVFPRGWCSIPITDSSWAMVAPNFLATVLPILRRAKRTRNGRPLVAQLHRGQDTAGGAPLPCS